MDANLMMTRILGLILVFLGAFRVSGATLSPSSSPQADQRPRIEGAVSDESSLGQDKTLDFDLIITLCAEEVCPFVNAKVEILHWPFPDPADKNDSAEEALKKFRKTRDQIKEKIKNYFNVNS